MATKTFSSRADEKKLRFADEVTQRELGISFGQYCGTQVLEYVYRTGKLPDVEMPDKPSGIQTMRDLTARHRNTHVGTMPDEEIKARLEGHHE